jgi:hypothetical protein
VIILLWPQGILGRLHGVTPLSALLPSWLGRRTLQGRATPVRAASSYAKLDVEREGAKR